MSSLEAYQRLTLSWENLNVYIKAKKPAASFLDNFNVFAKETTVQIIKDVTAYASPGEMLAIMGASGSGKTTMLNSLTSRNVKNLKIEGSIRVNGMEVGSNINKITAYVPQFQSFIGSLTVKEHLYFVSRLKLPRHCNETERMKVVDEILSEMHLKKCKDNLISIPNRNIRLSGGEFKRLALASEILTKAPLLICDEPTTGLDHFLAAEVIGVMRNLADKGRTVICTIHQPSSSSFQNFDKVLLLAEGGVAFFGQPSDALTFLDNLGFSCPDNFNPADFFVRLLAIQPSKVQECGERVKKIQDAFKTTEYAKPYKAPTSPENDQIVKDLLNASNYKATITQEMPALIWRSFIVARRKFRNMIGSQASTWAVTLLASLIFWSQGRRHFNMKESENLCGAMFFFNNFFSALNLNKEVFSMMTEFPPVFKENRARLYSCFSYVTSRLVSEIPLDVVSTFIHSLVFYWSVGLYHSGTAFANFILIMIISVICAKIVGFLTVCLINSWVVLKAIVPPVMLSFNLMSGYFLNTKEANFGLSLVRDISFMHYSAEAMMANQWKNIKVIECENINNASCYHSGKGLLDKYGFKEENIYWDVIVLAIISVILYFVASIALYVRLQRNKN